MAAHVEKTAKGSVVSTNDHNRFSSHSASDVLAGLSELFYSRDHLPLLRKHRSAFEISDLGIEVPGCRRPGCFGTGCCGLVASNEFMQAHTGSAAVFRLGLKNGVFTTVAVTRCLTASTVTSISNLVPSLAKSRRTVARAMSFFNVGDHVVDVAFPICVPFL